jgi:hypothetical protein
MALLFGLKRSEAARVFDPDPGIIDRMPASPTEFCTRTWPSVRILNAKRGSRMAILLP